MKARSTRLAVEALEDRCVPSTVAYADFNKDGLMDIAAVTSPTTITVRLAKPDGSYTVSAILTAQKNRPIQDIYVIDREPYGVPDIGASSPAAGDKGYFTIWLGNGDGTFNSGKPEVFHWPPPPGHSGGW